LMMSMGDGMDCWIVVDGNGGWKRLIEYDDCAMAGRAGRMEGGNTGTEVGQNKRVYIKLSSYWDPDDPCQV